MAVIRMNYQSKALGMPTTVSIILPAAGLPGNPSGYAPGVKYQALYLLHGGFGDDSDYIHNTNIVRYAEEHKLAVIMPSVHNSCYTDYEDGPQYFTFVSEELPEVCEALYPISTRREDTFVAGLSMGSHGAMKFAMNHPEKFSAVLLMSGASYRPGVPSVVKTVNGQFDFDFDMKAPTGGISAKLNDPDYIRGTANDVYGVAKANAQQGKQLPKVFFRVGDCDHALYRALRAEQDLRQWGYETVIEVVKGLGHEWDLWDETLRIALREWLPIKHRVLNPEDFLPSMP